MVSMRSDVTLDVAHLRGFELVRKHAERFVAYVNALEDAAVAAQVPGGAWTVGETVAHVQSVFMRCTVDHRRVDGRAGLVARNAEDVAALGVDIAAAVTSIREQLDVLAGVAPQVPAEQPFPFHGGQTITLAGGWGNLLGELLAHGDDIARATGSPFGIPSADLEILWRFTGHVLAAWMRPDAAAHRDRWRLRFPFGAIDVTFDAGRLVWDAEDVDEPPKHIIDVDDAADFALVFPYRRRSINDPTIAVLVARFYDL